ncbi:MAG: hypothetical protein M3P37_10370 [Actinomycetota bacterium]|nr:hypothetical protein [Actinomycetota bacterium]
MNRVKLLGAKVSLHLEKEPDQMHGHRPDRLRRRLSRVLGAVCIYGEPVDTRVAKVAVLLAGDLAEGGPALRRSPDVTVGRPGGLR